MTTMSFDYRVRDASGLLITGRLEGDSPQLVARRLRDMGYVPVGIAPSPRLDLHREIRLPVIGERVKLKDVAALSRQLATMLSSGLSLVRSLSLLGEQSDSPALRDALGGVRASVESGSSLSESLARYPRAFDRLYVAMVRAGELSGDLDAVLERLATATERRVALRAKVRSAMTYPLVMSTVAIAVVAAMLVFVVPTFSRLYGEFHGRLPLPTRLVIGLSHLVAGPWMLALVALLACATLLAARAVRTEQGRRVYDRLRLRVPVFGPMWHNVALERASSVLGALLGAGVGIIDALGLAADNAGNALVADALRGAVVGVRDGRSLGSLLEEQGVIPPMFAQMVLTGEETGSVGELLDKLAAFYQGQIESTVSSLTALLEPVMVVGMGALIGVVVVSLYLPMFKYITLVNGAH